MFSKRRGCEVSDMKKPLAVVLILAFGLMQVCPAFAAPQLLGVDAGDVSSETDGNVTNASASDRSVSNWDFDIWENEVFNLTQPSAQAVALFRDFTGDASHIFGSLNATGRLFLLNTNGVLFGQNAAVNVGGLVASTLDMSNSDFLSGKYKFAQAGANAAAVVNQGLIQAADGGFVTLLGGAVKNEGTIIANFGSVDLAAGKTATVDIDGSGLVSVAVDESVTSQVYDSEGNTLKNQIENSGTIQANGGYVQLTARAAESAFDNVINHSGVVEAQSVSVQNGMIVFDGGDAGIVSVTGTVDASGRDAGETGGTVQILGDKVALYNGASVDVSGTNGGGTALIGGDYRGEGDVRTASRTYVGDDVTINADAVDNGNGGKVVVWADGDTRYYGDISAKGGENGGDGGFVEVSGKEDLHFNGEVNTTAKNGETGTLLLDPTNITIANGAAGADDGQLPDILFGDSSGSNFTIAEQTLENLFTNVILQARQDLTVNNLTDNNLHFQNITDGEYVSFQAGRHITMDSTDMLSTVGGDIHLEADSPHSNLGGADGTGTLTLGSLDSAGGDITLIGADDFTLGGIIDAGSGNVNIALSENSTDMNIGTGGGTENISDAELDKILTTGTLTLGQATTKGTNGAGSGAVVLTAEDVTFDNLTQGSKNISIIGEAISAEELTTTGNVSLTSTIGDIDDANGSATNITANNLTISAAAAAGGGDTSAIDLDTAVASVTASTAGTGTIDLSDADGVTYTSVVSSNGNVTLAAAGNMIATTVTANGGSSDVVLTTTSGGNVVVNTITAADDVTITSAGTLTENPDAAADVIGDTFTFTSAGAVDLDTTVNSVNGSVTGAGDINLNESNGANILNVNVTSGNATVTTASGNLNVTTVTASGTVNLDATAGAITDADGNNDVTASSLVANAATGIDLDTTVTNLTATTTGAGNINLDELNGANVLNVNAANGNATVTSATGNLNVTTLGASGVANLTATTGAIIDTNGAANNVNGTSLVASSATGIDLDTTVGSITATTTGIGAIDLSDADAVTLTSVTSADGNITVASGGTMTATSVVANGAGRNVSLTAASGGNIAAGTITALGDTVTLNASGAITDGNAGANNISSSVLNATAVSGIDLDTTVASVTGSVTGTGSIDLSDFDGITLTSLTTNNGDITVAAAGDMTATSVTSGGTGGDITLTTTGAANDIDLGVLTAEGDRVTLTATAGSITDANGAANNVAAAALVATAATGIGASDRIETAVSNLEASGGTGGARFINTGDLTIGGITGMNGVSATAGNVEVAALSDLKINENVTAGGAGTVSLAASEDVEIASGATVSSNSGLIQIGAGEDLSDNTFDQDGNINGSLLMVDGSTVSSSSGNIVLQARRDVDLSTVTTAGGADVTVLASGGDISDVTAAEAANITADVVTLTALSGINATAADGNLNTAANSIDASVTGTGNMSLRETDAVTLTDVDAANGSISVTAGGAITATDVASLTNSDNNDITLTTTAGNILLGTVNAGTNGDVTLNAAGAVTDNNAGANNITADDLVVTGTAVGSGDAIETSVANLEGQATAGNFQIANTGALVIGGITAMNGVTATGNVSITTASPMTVSEQVSSTAGGNVTLASLGSTAADDLTIQADVIASGGNGNITLVAGDTVSIGNNTVSAAGTGAVAIVAGEDFTDGIDAGHAHDGNVGAAGGRVLMTGGTAVRSEDGNISIDAQGDLSPNGAEINANSDGDLTKGNVSLTSHFGSVGFADITSAALALASATGIGTPGQRLQLSVSNFEANGGTGGVYVENTGALIIGGADATMTGVTTAGGDIEIFSKSPLTVDEAVTNTGGGDIWLAATGTTAADDLTLNANVTATGGNGSIVLAAGDDVIVTGSRTVSAAGSGDVTVAAGENFIDEEIDQDGNADGDLTMTSGTTFSSTNGQVNLYATSDIALGAASTSDIVRLQAGSGAITDLNGPAANVTAGSLEAAAATGIDLDTVVTNLSAVNSGAGNITIDESNGANLLNINAANGNATITTATGNLNLSTVAASGTANLTATTGAITDGNGASMNITAANLVLTSATGVGTGANGLETQVSNLEAVGGSGGVNIANTGALTIGGIGATTGVSATGGDITVTAASPLTVGETVSNTGGGNITLAALGAQESSDLAVNANVTTTGGSGNILLAGGDNVGLGAGVSVSAAGTGGVTLAAGEDFSDGSLNRDGNVTGSVVMNATSSVQSQDGNITIDARDSAAIAAVNANSNAAGAVGDVTIGAQTGAITDANGATLNITGDQLGMTANSGIGSSGDRLETQVNNLEASGGNGGIFVANTGALTIGGVSAALSGLLAAGGNILVTSSSPMTVNEQVSNTGGGDITLAALGAAASDDLTVNANVSASGGNGAVTLVAGDTVTLNNVQVSTTGTGDVTLMGGEDFTDGIDALHAHDGNLGLAGGQVNMTGTSSVTVEDGDVLLDGQGNVTVGAINLDSDADLIEGSLELISHSGALLDGNGGAVNINGGSAVLSGATGVGASGNALETNLDRLEAFGGTGGVYVDNRQDLIIGGISSMVGVSATGGDIEVSAKGSLAADEAVALTGAGHINLTAEGSADGDNLDINANVTAGTGNILLAAGDTVSFSSGTVTSTTGSGTVTVAAGEDFSDNILDQDGSADGEILMGSTSEIRTNSGNILLDARSNVNLAVANADFDAAGGQGDVTIFSRLGKISDSNGATLNVTGDDLEMTAANGIATNGDRLETRVNNLEAVTGTGGIFLANTGALEIGNAAGSVVGVTAGGGDIVITAQSPINVVADVSNTGGGDITLAALGAAATDDITVDANVTATGGNGDIRLISGDSTSILAGRTVSTAGTGTVTVAAGEDFTDGLFDQDGNAGGDITMASTASILTEDGNVLLDARDNISVATVNAESDNDTIFGDVTLVARAGAITDSNGAILNITTDRLAMSAATGIATDADRLETATERMEANGGTGGVFVLNTGALTIGGVTAALSGVDAGDAVLIFSTGPMTVNEDVTNTGVNELVLAATGTGATADMQVNANVSSLGGGDTYVIAGDTVTLGNGTLVSASGAGEVNVLAGEDAADEIIDQDGNAGGDVIMNANSAIESDDGNILIDAANNVEVASVDADADAAGAAGTVTINARTGTITDANANALNVSGGALAMTAAAGIATNANRLETSVDNLEASGGTGGVFVENTGALTIGGVTAALAGVSATGSDIKVFASSPLTVTENVSNTGGGNIELAAKGAAASDDLTVTSGADIAATGGNGTVLLVAGDTVSIDSGSDVSAVGTGTVTVAAGENYTDEILDQDGNTAGDITMGATGSVRTQTGNILLDAADSIAAGVINANSDANASVGDVTLLARTGSITDSNAGTLNITADALEMRAATGIATDGDRLETQVNNLEASGGTGGIFVANTGALTIGGVTSALSGLLATGSDIKVTAASPMTVDEDVLNSGGGDILLAALGSAATDDLTINANVTASGGNGNITLAAGDTVTFVDKSIGVPDADSDNVTVSAAGTGQINVLAGEDLTDSETAFNQDGSAAGDIIMQADNIHLTQSRIRSEDGGILLDARDEIEITQLNANSDADGSAGQVSIFARDGSILDVNDVISPLGKVLNITASSLDMRATTGIATDSNRLETVTTNLAASGGTGGIYVSNTGALVIDTVSSLIGPGDAVSGLTATGQDIIVTAESPVTINAAVSDSGGGNIVIAALGSAATDDMAINANVTATGGNGNITLAAGDSVTQAAGVTVSADGTGNVNVLAGEDLTDSATVFDQDGNAAGDITMASTAVIQSQDGNLLIDARDNVVLAVANANSDADATLGDVTVNARAGSITDANGATLNVTGDQLGMTAATGIATDADRLETAVNNLEASGGTGGVYVADDGTLVIGGVSGALTGVSATGQDIKVTSTSTLTVNEAVANSGGATAGQGNILLGSIGSSFGDDIVLNANVSATGGNANVVVAAGDDVSIADGAVVSTQGTGQVQIHAGEDLTDSETVFNQDGNTTGTIRMAATGTVQTEEGDVLLDARNDIELGVVNADSNNDNNRGDVTLIARNAAGTDRNIIDMNGAALNITADELDMTASTGIATDGDRLETKVNTIAASGGTGGIYVHNTGALVIGDVTGFTGVLLSGLTATGENIKVTAASPITVNSAVSDTGGGDIVIGALGNLATDDITLNANVTTTGGNGNVTIAAGDSVIQAAGILVSADDTGDVHVLAGEDLTDSETTFNQDGNAGGDITMASTAEIRSQDGNLLIDARDNVVLAVANANSDADASLGNAEIQARAGSVTDANGATNNVTANELAISGATGMATDLDRLETTVNILDGFGGTGGFFLENTGALTIGTGTTPLGTALTGVSATGGDVKVIALSPMIINEAVVNSGGGNILLAAKGPLATDDMTVNANVLATGGNGNIVVAAGDTVTMAEGVIIGAAGTGDVTVLAGEDLTDSETAFNQDGNTGVGGGDILMGPTSAVQSQDGDVLLDAADDILLGIANGDSDGDNVRGDVTTLARAGSITDANAADLNITAQTATLLAFGNIGTVGDPIEINAVTVTGGNTGSGSTFLSIIGDSILDDISSPLGDIGITGTNSVYVNAISAPTGTINMNIGNSIFATGDPANDFTAFNLWLVAQNGVIGTAEAPILVDLRGGSFFLNAGNQINELSANINSNVGRNGITFLNTPPGLVLLDNHIEGGGNLQSLFKSMSIQYKIGQEAFNSYGQFGQYGLYDQAALVIPNEIFTELSFIESQTVLIQEPEILLEQAAFTDL